MTLIFTDGFKCTNKFISPVLSLACLLLTLPFLLLSHFHDFFSLSWEMVILTPSRSSLGWGWSCRHSGAISVTSLLRHLGILFNFFVLQIHPLLNGGDRNNHTPHRAERVTVSSQCLPHGKCYVNITAVLTDEVPESFGVTETSAYLIWRPPLD